MNRTDTENLRVIDLGRMAYAAALAEQRRVHELVLTEQSPPTLLLVEHDPVITVTPRPAARSHLLASPQRLAALGIDVQKTDRGGDITYHGPGQLVAYPILRLAPLGLNIGRYMRMLEQVVIDTLGPFGIKGQRVEGATGVWVKNEQSAKPQASWGAWGKICAIGVRVRRNVTMHGLALNVTTDLFHFDTIVPCGLTDGAVTSMSQLLGEKCPSMEDVKRDLARTFHTCIQSRSFVGARKTGMEPQIHPDAHG